MDRSQRFLSLRYARAFLNLHSEISLKDLPAFERAVPFFKEHHEVCFLFDLSLLSLEDKQKAFARYSTHLGLPLSCMELFMLLLTHKRSGLLASVFEVLVKQVQVRSGTLFFTVETAIPFSEDDKKEIEAFLQQQVAAPVICKYEIRESLLAGIRIYNENYVWEHSARAQLRALTTLEKR